MRGWEVSWSHAGLWSLRQIPWRDGGRVDAAVMAYAASGQGKLKRINGDPRQLLLLVAPYAVRLTLDPFDRKIVVWWVFRGAAR